MSLYRKIIITSVVFYIIPTIAMQDNALVQIHLREGKKFITYTTQGTPDTDTRPTLFDQPDSLYYTCLKAAAEYKWDELNHLKKLSQKVLSDLRWMQELMYDRSQLNARLLTDEKEKKQYLSYRFTKNDTGDTQAAQLKDIGNPQYYNWRGIDSLYYTCLTYAAQQEWCEKLKKLSPTVYIDFAWVRELSRLNPSVHRLRFLAKRGANVNIPARGHLRISVLRHPLSNDVRIDTKSCIYKYALSVGTWHLHEDFVKFLLQKGAHANVPMTDTPGYENATPLNMACSCSRPELANQLLAHGARVNTAFPPRLYEFLTSTSYNTPQKILLLQQLFKAGLATVTTDELRAAKACGIHLEDIVKAEKI